jgi:DNA-binding FadR family transcriptional regulator
MTSRHRHRRGGAPRCPARPDTDAVEAIRALMGFHALIAELAGNQTVALLTDLVRRHLEGSEDY